MNLNKPTLKLNWKLSLFTFGLLPVLIYLGFWQLDRAEQKRTLLQNWQRQQAQPMRPLSKVWHDNQVSGPVSFRGSFEADRFWLHEAQILDGRPGYHVYMMAISEYGQIVLINRGWIPSNPDRSIKPSVNTPDTLINISGMARSPSNLKLVDERNNPVSSWPHRVLEIDLKLIEEQSGTQIPDWVIDLDADNEAAFIVSPRTINISPQKHHGYAIQWFAMAAVLLFLWFSASCTFSNTVDQDNNDE